MAGGGCWSDLNGDLLITIVTMGTTGLSLEDRIRIRAVCKSWRFFLTQTSITSCLCDRDDQFPWLVLPYDHITDGDDEDRRGFYSLTEKRVHRLKFPEAKPDRKRCVGSSYGWLAMVDWTNPSISIMNPLTGSRIELPPFTTFPDVLEFRPDKPGEEYLCKRLPRERYGEEERTFSATDVPDFYIYKIALSSNPTSKKEDTIAMAICSVPRGLAFCRVGEEISRTGTWIPLKINGYLTDLVYWRNQFYAVNCNGGLVFCDFTSSSPAVKVVFDSPRAAIGVDCCAWKYLAVDPISDELLMILRFTKDQKDHVYGDDDEIICYCFRTTKFEVYRLVVEEKLMEWEKMKGGIGNNKVLFLGCNTSSVCLCTDNIDESTIKPNCIYFTNEMEGYTKNEHLMMKRGSSYYGRHDMGIYDFEHGTITTLPCCPDLYSPTFFWSPPIWLTPSLQN